MISYESRIGLRYLFSKKGDFLVSVLTVIAVTGVAIGVTALVVVLAVLSGFERDFREKILGSNSHLIVLNNGRRLLDDFAQPMTKILKSEAVVAAAPFVSGEVLVHGKGDRSSGIMLYGIDPVLTPKVLTVGNEMMAGSLQELAWDQAPSVGSAGGPPGGPNDGKTRQQRATRLPGIVVGAELANHNLYLLPGDIIEVVAPSGEITPFGVAPKLRRFEVVGIFKSGLYEYDARSAYIHIDQAQQFFGLGKAVSGIQVRIRQPERAWEAGPQLQRELGEEVLVRSWMDLNRDLFSAFKLEKTVFFIVLAMIILVAACNIVGTLVTVVTEKQREVAVLKAIGATRAAVTKIFVVTGTAIGVMGTVLGLGLGLGLTVMLRDYIKFPLNANVYQVEHLPVFINPLDYLLVAVSALLITLAATLYPSWKAGSMLPVEGLRYE